MKRTKNKEMLPLLFHEEEGSIFFVAHLFGGLMFAWMAAKSFALQPPMEWERGTFVLLVMGAGCIAGAVSSLWRGRTMGVLLLNLLAPFGVLAAISAGQQGAAWVKGPFVLWAVVMGYVSCIGKRVLYHKHHLASPQCSFILHQNPY